jgi:hypothetical protein
MISDVGGANQPNHGRKTGIGHDRPSNGERVALPVTRIAHLRATRVLDSARTTLNRLQRQQKRGTISASAETAACRRTAPAPPLTAVHQP